MSSWRFGPWRHYPILSSHRTANYPSINATVACVSERRAFLAHYTFSRRRWAMCTRVLVVENRPLSCCQMETHSKRWLFRWDIWRIHFGSALGSVTAGPSLNSYPPVCLCWTWQTPRWWCVVRGCCSDTGLSVVKVSANPPYLVSLVK